MGRQKFLDQVIAGILYNFITTVKCLKCCCGFLHCESNCYSMYPFNHITLLHQWLCDVRTELHLSALPYFTYGFRYTMLSTVNTVTLKKVYFVSVATWLVHQVLIRLVYKSHREKAIYYIPGVKVLRPQIILPNIVANNFVETDTKISSLFMLTAIKYHQGSS